MEAVTSMRSAWISLLALGLTLGAGLAGVERARAAVEVPTGGIKTSDLFVVDCLLPGQVRQMGESFTYVSARRPIRTTAKDCAIRGGEYVAYDRANYGTALKVWLPAANAGDANAMNYVGEIYEKGLGVAPDYALAEQWYRKAAEKGNSTAMINLGSMYEAGRGVPQDMVQAMNWYRKASGIKDGELEVVTEAEKAERARQAEELERLRAESGVLREELRRTREQLRQREQALNESKRELERAQAEAKRLKADSAAAKLASQRIAELERMIASQQDAVRQLEGDAQAKLARLGGEPVATADGKPRISIIAPKLALTRAGTLSAPILAQMPTYQVMGRVSAPGGLRSLRVNGQEYKDKVDEDGIFEAEVAVGEGDTPVEVQAIAQDGSSTLESFVLANAAPDQDVEVAKRVTSKLFQRRMRKDLGNFHALVIGNADYAEFADLKTAVNDARAVADTLRERYGYKVTLLTDATGAQIVQALSELTTQLKPVDNLLIYYAGHGQLDAQGNGYWVPVEGKPNDSQSWIANKVVTDFVGATQARHVLIVADSCYSGSLSGNAIRPLPLDAREEDLLFVSRVRARTVITSGGLEPVVDDGGGGHSIFAGAFLQALRSNEGLTEGMRMFQGVRSQVVKRARALGVRQQPSYSALKFAGHEGSEFFFLPRET